MAIVKYTKKKKVYRKKTYRPRKVKKIANQLHRYVRWADKDVYFPDITHGPTLITETGADQSWSYSFCLRNVVNAVDFTSLYDMYKINKVTIFIERFGVFGNNNVGPLNKFFRVVHDYNDNDLLVSEDDFLEYSNCKSYPSMGTRPIKIVLYPKIADKVENVNGGTAFTAVSSNKVWLNTVNDQVPHFGVKLFVPGGIAAGGQAICKIRVKFDMTFKNSH